MSVWLKLIMEDNEDFIRSKVEEESWTHRMVSDYLQQRYPGERGYSIRSVERFCSDKDIHRTVRLDTQELHQVVTEAVGMVGPAYGRKTMTGFLASQGIKTSEKRVGEALHHVFPGSHHHRRTSTARQLNPIPYRADYFGHKVHIDQNEKVVMFGMTHVCAIDGYSGKIVGLITMPIKNCLEIYTHLYRPIVLQYGLWDQLRVDQGREWNLMLFVQEKLAHLRRNIQSAPHLQTTSKLNHPVERIWVEINTRVNYPLKSCLISLQERGDIDMDDEHTKYCVSWFVIRVANVGTAIAVEAWNNHPIPGPRRGIPNQLMRRNNQAMKIDPQLLPCPNDAVREIESLGSHLTHFSPFGTDPLTARPDLVQQRAEAFTGRYSDFNAFFYTVVNGDFSAFRNGLLYLIQTSKDLESLIYV